MRDQRCGWPGWLSGKGKRDKQGGSAKGEGEEATPLCEHKNTCQLLVFVFSDFVTED